MKIYRSAKTGRFVSAKTAKRKPATTYAQTIDHSSAIYTRKKAKRKK